MAPTTCEDAGTEIEDGTVGTSALWRFGLNTETEQERPEWGLCRSRLTP